MSLFRVARDATAGHHLRTTCAQIVVFWSTFLWFLPAGIHAASRHFAIEPLHAPSPTVVGAGLFALASALGLWSGFTMAIAGRGTPLPLATARHFVTIGPYRRLRNPMALAGTAQGVAVGIWRDDPWVLLYALVGSVVWHWLARPPEERDLLARFGDDYRRWRDREPLWIPRLVPRPVERVLGSLLVFWAAVLFAGACLHRQHVWPVAGWSALAGLVGAALVTRSRGDRHPP